MEEANSKSDTSLETFQAFCIQVCNILDLTRNCQITTERLRQ